LDVGTESKKQNIPGPGAYKELAMAKTGKYPVSTYNNSKASNFMTGRRFKSIDATKFVPGPGAYEHHG